MRKPGFLARLLGRLKPAREKRPFTIEMTARPRIDRRPIRPPKMDSPEFNDWERSNTIYVGSARHWIDNDKCPYCDQGYPIDCDCGGLVHAGTDGDWGGLFVDYECDRCHKVSKGGNRGLGGNGEYKSGSDRFGAMGRGECDGGLARYE